MASQQGEFNFRLLLYSCELDVYCYLSQGRRDGTSLVVVWSTALLLLGRVCSCGQDARTMHPVYMTALRSERFYLGWTCSIYRGDAGNSLPPVEHLHWDGGAMLV